MKKNVLALLIASSISLYGCGDESELTGNPTIDPGIGKSLQEATIINFDLLTNPKKPIIVAPTFLAMNSTDGTLATEKLAKDPTDWSDPMVTMGKTDGWSTTQPIIIEFTDNKKEGLTGSDLELSTAVNGFYLIKSRNPTDPSSTEHPEMLSAQNGDFMVTTSGKTLTVVLLNPLDPASNYMFAVTNDLKDIKGHSVGMSGSYGTLKTTAHPPSEALVPAQKIVHSIEKEFEKAGVNPGDIIFSSWFTTASVGDVLFATKAASALALQSPNGARDVWQGSAISDNVEPSELDNLFSMGDLVDAGNTTAGNEIYTGTVHLPYFLETSPLKFNTTPWQSGMPSLAAIKHILSDENASDADKTAVMQQLTTWGITKEDLKKVSTDKPTQQKIIPILTGKTIMLANGKTQLDTDRLITRYSPVPKLKSVEPIEYTLVLPSKKECQGTAKNTVSIFQHGITVDKNVLTTTGLADSIIGDQCHAIFAIDHPLHGTRGITLPDGSKINANAKSEMYLNLKNLPVARDNLRQSTIDLVNLRMSIGLKQAALAKAIQDKDLDAIGNMGKWAWLNPINGVSFSGHSLGGMTGVTLGNIANIPTTPDPATDNMLFNINKLALANPGAGIPYLLLESGEFGDLVKGSLVAAKDQDFKDNCDAKAGGNYKLCYKGMEAGLIMAGTEESKATLKMLYSNFSLFAFAAQNVLDTVDPINHSMLISETLPVYLSEVKDDDTIPNKLIPRATVPGTDIAKPYSPFGGTEPLMKTMQLLPVTSDIPTETTVRNAILFKDGGHGALLNTGNNSLVTDEMRNQINLMLNGNGKGLLINNEDDIIDAAPEPIRPMQ